MTHTGLGIVVVAIVASQPLSNAAKAQSIAPGRKLAEVASGALLQSRPPYPDSRDHDGYLEPERWMHASGRHEERVGVPERALHASAADRPDTGTGQLEHSRYRLSTLKSQTGQVGWEMAGLTAALTATRIKDVTKGGSGFHFKSEGWFGRRTESLGMDKVHHAWKTYVVADVLQSLIEERSGRAQGSAYTGAFLAIGLLTYGEVLDGFTARTGFSNEDMASHLAGAGLSVLRNSVPGLREKIDFRMEVDPAGFGKDARLVDQLSRRKYLIAAQLAGFQRFENSPWRFVELHFGYYGRGFSQSERAEGDPLRRKIFVGVGFNVQQLFSAKPASRVERWSKGVFDYVQLPYTSVTN